jgi:hypothetical protein
VIAWTRWLPSPDALPWIRGRQHDTRDFPGNRHRDRSSRSSACCWPGLPDDELAIRAPRSAWRRRSAALGLAALEVVNVMVLPADAPYRLLGDRHRPAVAHRRLRWRGSPRCEPRSADRFRLSPLGARWRALGIVIVVAYLLMLQTMVAGAPDADDSEWARLTTLLAGMQTWCSPDSARCLGAVLQGQVTSTARSDLRKADEALRLVETETTDIVREMRTRIAESDRETEAVLVNALRQDPGRFRTEAALHRWIAANRPESAGRARRSRRQPGPGRRQRTADPRRLRFAGRAYDGRSPHPEEEPTMDNQALKERISSAFASGDFEGLSKLMDEMVGDDFVLEYPQSGERFNGWDTVKQMTRATKAPPAPRRRCRPQDPGTGQGMGLRVDDRLRRRHPRQRGGHHPRSARTARRAAAGLLREPVPGPRVAREVHRGREKVTAPLTPGRARTAFHYRARRLAISAWIVRVAP